MSNHWPVLGARDVYFRSTVQQTSAEEAVVRMRESGHGGGPPKVCDPSGQKHDDAGSVAELGGI
jgi:hypothetical protein